MVRTLLALQGGLLRGALAQVLSAEHDIEIVGEVDSPRRLRAAVRAERPDVAVVEFDMLTVAELVRLATAEPTAESSLDARVESGTAPAAGKRRAVVPTAREESGTDPTAREPGTDPIAREPGTDPIAREPGTDPTAQEEPGTDPAVTARAGTGSPSRPAGPPVGALLVLVEQRRAGRLGPLLAEHGHRIGFLSREVPPGRIVDGVRQLAEGRVVLDPDLVVAALEVADSPLTNREREVLDVVAEGHPVQEIAERLVLSAGTVRNHLSRIMAKTGARTRWEAVRIARESGWL
ncbi:response regulator transcription factor [Micromonospora sp. WMMD714]|uniref:response regulator transcription factor n=1 Tax=Micromonospora sp. WMMD714 TaxID=3016097 RepID=UPI00249BA833|nr:response regulator transcription factor [Micromonospora sp. WMMD714]WFE65719.1 response regulator transcription factor [Micromonospora sp. WMMD714]